MEVLRMGIVQSRKGEIRGARDTANYVRFPGHEGMPRR
jgi:hypothetical protein